MSRSDLESRGRSKARTEGTENTKVERTQDEGSAGTPARLLLNWRRSREDPTDEGQECPRSSLALLAGQRPLGGAFQKGDDVAVGIE